MNELYEELETPDGERKIYRIAKAQYKMTKDFTKNNQIKDDQRVFDKLLNEENHRSVFQGGVSNDGSSQGISRNYVKVTLSGMKKGKTTGIYGIPAEVSMCFFSPVRMRIMRGSGPDLL